jgi:hypothetical protein
MRSSHQRSNIKIWYACVYEKYMDMEYREYVDMVFDYWAIYVVIYVLVYLSNTHFINHFKTLIVFARFKNKDGRSLLKLI